MNESIAYFNGKYLPKEKIAISPDDRGFLFADGVYEVIRSYKGSFFLFEKHITRLRYSLREIRIDFSDFLKIKEIAYNLLKKNELLQEDAIIYIQITRGAFKRMHQFPSEKILPTVYVTASKTRYFPDEVKNGVKVITLKDLRWGRCDIKSIALLANILAQQEARDQDAVEAIFVKNGLVTEGSHTGVFGVKDGKILTHPTDNKVLPSITRELIFELAEKIEIPIKEFPIYENQLYSLDEFFIVGTSTEITPVIQINETKIGQGIPGEITQKLQKAFNNYLSSLK